MSVFVACKDCLDRGIGCHETCDAYKQERIEHKRLKALAERDEQFRLYRTENSLACRDRRAKKQSAFTRHGKKYWYGKSQGYGGKR